MLTNYRSIASWRVAASAATLLSIGFWLVIATFPDFFFFNPLNTLDPVLRVEQLFSTTAWVIFSIFPMMFSWVRSIKGRSTLLLFQVSCALWPLSVLIIQVTLAVRGSGFYLYLSSFPILAFYDLLVPIFLLLSAKVVFTEGSTEA